MTDLSKRLSLIADMCPGCGCAADIGCDHGYISIELIERGIADRAIAADLREGPLARAKNNITAAGLDGRIETRLSDGLTGFLPNEADVIIIAGMGGRLIEEIIERGIAVVRVADAVILGPQSEYYRLRRYLYDAGFVITDEDMAAEDGKYYPVISARYAIEDDGATGERMLPDDAGLRYGPVLVEKRHPVLREYLTSRKCVLEHNLESIRLAGDEAVRRHMDRLTDIEAELSDIYDILEVWDPKAQTGRNRKC